MNWDKVIKAYETFDSCFKTDACKTCGYSNIGIGLCDTCSNLRFPDKKYAENHHSDHYYTKEYDKMMKEDWEEDMCEYDWFGLVRKKK